jgi:hypothetical protein
VPGRFADKRVIDVKTGLADRYHVEFGRSIREQDRVTCVTGRTPRFEIRVICVICG